MRVLCSGSYLADILVPGLPRIGPPGSLTYAPRGIHLSPGGHSANVALDLAQLGQGDIHSTGCLGNDAMGEYVTRELVRGGVQAYPQVAEGVPTAKNVALIVEGEDRRFIAELTANTLLEPRHVMGLVERLRPDVLYQGTVGGLRYIDAQLSAVLGHARSHGAATLVDAIPPTGGWGHMEEAYPYMDVLHLNLQEARQLTGQEHLGRVLDLLAENHVPLAVVSDGERGLYAVTDSSRLKMPAFKVKAVDQTGAGDALCAGIIDSLDRHGLNPLKLGEAPMDALTRVLMEAQAAGAACVTGIGAATNVNREITEALIRDQGEAVLAAVEAVA
ncbi:MAG: carbohydrate kinase family protein [Candidatus Bathyarchaeota archaeon]